MTCTRRRDVSKTETYLSHRQAGIMRGDGDHMHDCSVRAVAVVTGLTYEKVHALFTSKGRQAGRGTDNEITFDVLFDLGYLSTPVDAWYFIQRYPGNHKRKKYVTTHQADRFPKIWKDGNSYLLWTRGHMLAIVDGINHDWTRGRSHKVLHIRKVTLLNKS